MAKRIKLKKAAYNRFSIFDFVNYILMFALMASVIVPFMHIISVSVSHNDFVVRHQVSLLPKGFTLNTYINVIKNGEFVTAYCNTILYTLLHTVLSLMVTAMGAYALARRKIVGHGVFSLMITITMFFGGGMIPTYMAVSDYGLINTRWAMVIPSLISTWNLIVMRSFFVAYPQEIVESGEIDGLQEAGVFFRLVLPTSKAALATIGLYYAVAAWNAYMPARLYLRDETLYPVQHYLRQLLAQNSRLEELEGGDSSVKLVADSIRYASIMIATIPIMCVYPFIQKYFVKGVMVGSIKG